MEGRAAIVCGILFSLTIISAASASDNVLDSNGSNFTAITDNKTLTDLLAPGFGQVTILSISESALPNGGVRLTVAVKPANASEIKPAPTESPPAVNNTTIGVPILSSENFSGSTMQTDSSESTSPLPLSVSENGTTADTSVSTITVAAITTSAPEALSTSSFLNIASTSNDTAVSSVSSETNAAAVTESATVAPASSISQTDNIFVTPATSDANLPANTTVTSTTMNGAVTTDSTSTAFAPVDESTAASTTRYQHRITHRWRTTTRATNRAGREIPSSTPSSTTTVTTVPTTGNVSTTPSTVVTTKKHHHHGIFHIHRRATTTTSTTTVSPTTNRVRRNISSSAPTTTSDPTSTTTLPTSTTTLPAVTGAPTSSPATETTTHKHHHGILHLLHHHTTATSTVSPTTKRVRRQVLDATTNSSATPSVTTSSDVKPLRPNFSRIPPGTTAIPVATSTTATPYPVAHNSSTHRPKFPTRRTARPFVRPHPAVAANATTSDSRVPVEGSTTTPTNTRGSLGSVSLPDLSSSPAIIPGPPTTSGNWMPMTPSADQSTKKPLTSLVQEPTATQSQ